MINEWFGNWAIGTALGLAALGAAAVVVPAVAPNHGDPSGLQARLRAGSSMFAAFTGPSNEGTPSLSHRAPGLLRWTPEGVVVLQTDDLRLRWDGQTLWEDGPSGLMQPQGLIFERAGDLVALIRRGFPQGHISPVRPGALPGYLWAPGIDLFEVPLPEAWGDSWRLLVGLAVVDGELAELALTDASGVPLVYQGHTLRASFDRVQWGVPVGPDMAETRLVPIQQLGYRTVFSRLPPQVLRDLPYHERVQHHALAFVPDRSEGVQGAHGEAVTDVLMPTVWCDTEDVTGHSEARIVFDVDPTAPTAAALEEAAAAGCSLWISAEPKTTHVLGEQVTGALELSARLQIEGSDDAVWAQSVRIVHEGPGIRYGQPVLRGAVPAGVDPALLEFLLDVSMDVDCAVAQGKGRMRTYFAGITRPRLHWICPPSLDAPTLAGR